MLSKQKKGYIGIVVTILILAAAAVWWQAERPFSSGVQTTDKVVSDTADQYFEELGIIKDPSIAPPVNFELEDLKGHRVQLSDFTGKVVFLHFWATWCSECRIEMSMLERLYQHFKGREFAMLAVSLRESESRVSQYVNREKLNFSTLLDSDGRVGRRFGIRSIPTTIIINQGGAMIGKIIGSRNWNSPAAMALFEQLIKHPPERRAAVHP